MRPVVHPNGLLRVVGRKANVIRDQLLRGRVDFLPDAQRRRSAPAVVGAVRAALIFGNLDNRGAPALGAEKPGGVDRHAEVVAHVGARQAVALVFEQGERPIPGGIDLRESRAAQHRHRRKQQNRQTRNSGRPIRALIETRFYHKTRRARDRFSCFSFRRLPAGDFEALIGAMATPQTQPRAEVVVRPLAENELAQADQMVRVAFGTFLGMPDPSAFMGDANYAHTRWKADPTAVLAAAARWQARRIVLRDDTGEASDFSVRSRSRRNTGVAGLRSS